MPGCPGWINGSVLSWRVMILPYMDQQPLADQVNDLTGLATCYYTNTAGNNAVLQTIVEAYICPSDPTTLVGSDAPTNYPAIVGRNANAFRYQSTPDNERGILRYEGSSFALCSDGLSNTAMVGEVHRGVRFNRLSSGPVNATGQRCRRWADASGFCGANAHVPNIANPDKELTNTGSANGNPEWDQISWTDSLNTQQDGDRGVSSAHSGGAQILFGDGKVGFLNDSVDINVWRNTVTRAGRETEVFEF